MEIKCPICDSSNQKETIINIKLIEPQFQQKIEVPAQIYICLDCHEDWQSPEQHQEFCNTRDNKIQK